MKPQEDIGSLIKSKLQATEKTSNEATWERIQHSLEERKQKRRFAFYIRLGATGLLVLIGVLLLINYASETNKQITTSKDTISVENQDLKDPSVLKEDNHVVVSNATTDVNSKKNSTKETEIDKQKNQKISTKTTIETAAAETIPEIKNNLSNDTKKTTSKAVSPKEELIVNKNVVDTILNSNNVPVTQTTQKVYYYYNSKNGQEISSMDKSVIDSIVKANQVKPDSLKTNN